MNPNAELQLLKPNGKCLQSFFLKMANLVIFPNTLSETPTHLEQLMTNSHSYNRQNKKAQ